MKSPSARLLRNFGTVAFFAGLVAFFADMRLIGGLLLSAGLSAVAKAKKIEAEYLVATASGFKRAQLNQLRELRDHGVISEKEFEAEMMELLGIE